MTVRSTAAPRTAGRDAATVTAWNLASRVTGFARVLVVGGALGATRLGDTYQAANQVSNILFEFLAAGTLSAVLVPGLVARLTRGDRDLARDFAGALLGRALAILGPIVVIGVICARPIMHALVAANSGPSRGAQIRLGAFLLLFVLPQLALYAWGAVVTAMLHADGRFAAAAIAPVANNVVVTVAMAAFWYRGSTGLGIGIPDRILLGGGTLGGVLCMTFVPAIAAWRAGLTIRPRLRGTTTTAAVRRDVGWASVVVIPPQLFLLASLVIAGRLPGGVVACQIAFTVFLLPHALLGQPVATVLYPRIAAAWEVEDRAAVRRHAGKGLTTSLMLTAPAAALLVALAPWIVRGVTIGALGRSTGPVLLTAALSGYGVGLCGHSWSLLTSRIAYASGDVRTPALAAVGGGLIGIGVLLAMAGGATPSTLRWIGFAHSAMVTGTAAATLTVLVRRSVIVTDGRVWTTAIGAAGAAGVAARVVANAMGPGDSRLAILGVCAVAASVGLSIYLIALVAGGARPSHVTADSE